MDSYTTVKYIYRWSHHCPALRHIFTVCFQLYVILLTLQIIIYLTLSNHISVTVTSVYHCNSILPVLHNRVISTTAGIMSASNWGSTGETSLLSWREDRRVEHTARLFDLSLITSLFQWCEKLVLDQWLNSAKYSKLISSEEPHRKLLTEQQSFTYSWSWKFTYT